MILGFLVSQDLTQKFSVKAQKSQPKKQHQIYVKCKIL